MDVKKLEVLIVEDNPGDVRLITEMLEGLDPSVHSTIALNGQIALDIPTIEDHGLRDRAATEE